jgi:hypothetical protein
MGSCNKCGKFGHKKGDFWEIDADKHKRPAGYHSANQANVTLDNNKEEDTIAFIMCGLCLPTEAGNYIRVQETLNDIVLMDEYADVIVTETTVNYEHICSDVNTDMGEVVLVDMKFPYSMRLLNDPNIRIGDTAASVHISP